MDVLSRPLRFTSRCNLPCAVRHLFSETKDYSTAAFLLFLQQRQVLYARSIRLLL